MTTTKNYQLHQKDTGSTAVQIIRLRDKIRKEKIHLESNKKDVPNTRALLKNIAKEKIFLKYLKRNNPEVYKELVKEKK